MNLFMKLSLSSPPTTLMCIADVVRHVNNAPHCLIYAFLCFTSIGPIRSTPFFVNEGFIASVHSDGRLLIKVSMFFCIFLWLQNEYLVGILFMSDFTLNIHYLCSVLSIESIYSVPIWSRLCMFPTMSSLLRCLLGKMTWCLPSYGIIEYQLITSLVHL